MLIKMDDIKFTYRIVLVEYRESDLHAFSLYDKQESCKGKKDLVETRTRMDGDVDFVIRTKVRDE